MSKRVMAGMGLLMAMAMAQGRCCASKAEWRPEFGQYVVSVRGVDGDAVSVACASASLVDGRSSGFIVFSPVERRVIMRGSEIYLDDSGYLAGLASWSSGAPEHGRIVAAWVDREGASLTDVLCLKSRKLLFRLPGRYPLPLHDLNLDGFGDVLVVATRTHDGVLASVFQFVSGASGEILEEWILPGEVTAQPVVLDMGGLASVQFLVSTRVHNTLRLVRKGRDTEGTILERTDAEFPPGKKLLPFSSIDGLSCGPTVFFASVVHNGSEENELFMYSFGGVRPPERLRAGVALADPWGWGANYFGSSVVSYRLGHGGSPGQVLVGAHGAELGMGMVVVFDAGDGRAIQLLKSPSGETPAEERPASTHFGNYLCLSSELGDGRGDWLLVASSFPFDAQPGALHHYEAIEGRWEHRFTLEEGCLK